MSGRERVFTTRQQRIADGRRGEVRPFPYALTRGRGGRWAMCEFSNADAARGTHGTTDIVDRKMMAPFNDDPISAAVRAHELLHAQFSPDVIPKSARQFDPHVVKQCEDARIHTIAAQTNIGATLHGNSRGSRMAFPDLDTNKARQALIDALCVDKPLPRAEVKRMALSIVARHNTVHHVPMIRDIIEYMPPVYAQRAETIRDVVMIVNNALTGTYVTSAGGTRTDDRRNFRTFRATIRMARDIEAYFDDIERKIKEGDAKRAAAAGDQKAPPGADDGSDAGAQDSDDGTDGSTPGAIAYADNAAGDMTIERPALSQRMPAKFIGRKTRCADTGVAVTRPDRFAMDGAVFRTRVPRGADVAILVDFSGSMELTPREVLEFLIGAPHATIAIYSGVGTKGVMRIIARDGRRVQDKHVTRPHGGGNVIDLPALEWLARVKASHRFWISDGHVTGRAGGGHNTILKAACAQVCKRARIIRVDDPDTFLATYMPRKRGGRR